MNALRLAKYIKNNDLSEEQLSKILADLIRDNFQYGYRRGYWSRDADVKKIRKARDKRIKREHETKELNQNK